MLHGFGAVSEITAGDASRFNNGYKGDYSRFFGYANLPDIYAPDLGGMMRNHGGVNIRVGLGIVAQQNKLMLWVSCQDSGNPVEFGEVLALAGFSELAKPL